MESNLHKNIRPLFIVGSPRSGTTVIAKAIDSLDGFYLPHVEGHMLYWLLEGVKKVSNNPKVYHQPFLPSSICSNGNFDKLLEWLGIAIDGFEREIGNGKKEDRWIDKTPDLAQLRILPTLFNIFPKAQAIFSYRHPRDIVLSTKNAWDVKVSDTELLRRWRNLHKEYREIIRPQLDLERILEIKQEKIVASPLEVGNTIGEFLGLENDSICKIGEFFSEKRINRTDERGKDQFTYVENASIIFNGLMKKICGSEMKEWGY